MHLYGKLLYFVATFIFCFFEPLSSYHERIIQNHNLCVFFIGLLSIHIMFVRIPWSFQKKIKRGNVIILDDNVIIPYDDVIIPDDNVIIPYDNVIIPDDNVIIPDDNVIISDYNIKWSSRILLSRMFSSVMISSG